MVSCTAGAGRASHGLSQADALSRTVETGASGMSQPWFTPLRAPQTAHSASAGAGGEGAGGALMAVRGQWCHRGQRAHWKRDVHNLVNGGALGCVCNLMPRSSWVYWLPLPTEAPSPLLISCAGTCSGLGTWIGGGKYGGRSHKCVFVPIKFIFWVLQKKC